MQGSIISAKTNTAYNLLPRIISSKNDIVDIILKPRKKFTGHQGAVIEFEWGGLANVIELISCDNTGTLIHYNASKGKKITYCSIPNQRFTSVDIDREYCRTGIAGTADGRVIVAELNNIKTTQKAILNSNKLYEINGHNSQVNCCKYLNGTYLISGSNDKTVCVWDIKSKKDPISKHNAHNAEVRCFTVSDRDGNIFLSGGADNVIKIWDIRIKSPIQAEFKGHIGRINDLKFLPGQYTTFISGSDDASLRLFDIRVEKELAVLTDSTSQDAIRNISLSSSGRILFAATESRYLKVWDLLNTGDPYQYIDYGFPNGLKCVRTSADGYAIAVSGDDGSFGIAY